jgi:hypothetical protein
LGQGSWAIRDGEFVQRDVVLGDLDMYFDAQPIKGWRSLVELRFTNAPQGDVQNYGGLAGTRGA